MAQGVYFLVDPKGLRQSLCKIDSLHKLPVPFVGVGVDDPLAAAITLKGSQVPVQALRGQVVHAESGVVDQEHPVGYHRQQKRSGLHMGVMHRHI